jgi:actin-related protein 3
MGYAGNIEPSYIVPSVIATNDAVQKTSAVGKKATIDDLDFHIGDEAVKNNTGYSLNYPIRHGQARCSYGPRLRPGQSTRSDTMGTRRRA